MPQSNSPRWSQLFDGLQEGTSPLCRWLCDEECGLLSDAFDTWSGNIWAAMGLTHVISKIAPNSKTGYLCKPSSSLLLQKFKKPLLSWPKVFLGAHGILMKISLVFESLDWKLMMIESLPPRISLLPQQLTKLIPSHPSFVDRVGDGMATANNPLQHQRSRRLGSMVVCLRERVSSPFFRDSSLSLGLKKYVSRRLLSTLRLQESQEQKQERWSATWDWSCWWQQW